MAVMPNTAPAWQPLPGTHFMDEELFVEVDDLNRLTLAATCEVLPACRDRGVTLVVGLAAEAIEVKGDLRQLEGTVASLLEEASRIATMTGAGARVRVETVRSGIHGEVRMITAGVIAVGLPPEAFAAAARVLREHGGTLKVVEEPGKRITMKVRLPVHERRGGGLEDRVEVPLPVVGPPMLPEEIRAQLPPMGRIKPVPAFLRGMGRSR